MIRGVDLFCGAGGSTTGLMMACDELGKELDMLAINHWNIAIATHMTNHPKFRHMCESLDAVSPTKAIPGGYLDIMLAGPECFPAGTLILTDVGYLPIESISKGMRVLTHKSRWMRVTGTMTSVKSTVVIKGQGHTGLECSGGHPIYTRLRRRLHRSIAGNYYRFEDPNWKIANEISGKEFWACPEVIPPLPIPSVCGRGFDFTPDFWRFIGLWLAEGTVRIRKRRSEITISCGNHEADAIERQLNYFAPDNNVSCGKSQLRWRRRKVRTATNFDTCHTGLARWIVDNFGRHSYGKTIPAWVYGMDEVSRRSLLEGYLKGDGHIERPMTHPKQTCQTVSRALAFSIRTLAATLGYRVSMHDRTPRSEFIEGRLVNIRRAYGVHWTISRGRNCSYGDGIHHWQRIKEITDGRKEIKVFNLSVSEDESYVAEGVVVHNCTHHSNARGGRPMRDQSRASAWHVVRWAESLYVDTIVIENVVEFMKWGPLDRAGHRVRAREGETFKAFIASLESLDYRVEWRVLNAADYGDATTRKRLFIIAKKAGQKIPWPVATNTNNWRPARDIIDWSIKGKSIFDRKKPLAKATMERIASGLKKYGGKDMEPFLIIFRNHQDAQSLDKPLLTMTTSGANYGLCEPFILGQQCSNRFGLCEPFIVKYYGTGTVKPVSDPVGTITAKDRMGLVEPEKIGTRIDIRFRMLQPHELSAAMGFPENYCFAGTREAKVRQIGNAWSVRTAKAICQSQLEGL